MNVYTSRINISIPTQFLRAVDRAALAQGMDRSTFIRVALKEKMGLKDMINLADYIEEEKPPKAQPTEGERKAVAKRLSEESPHWELFDEELKRCLIDIEVDKVK